MAADQDIARKEESRQSRPATPWPLVASWALLTWATLAAAEIGLHLAIPGTTLRSAPLPPATRWVLICHELSLLAGAVAVIAVPLILLHVRLTRAVRRRGVLRRLCRIAGIALVSLLLLFWAASWATFRSTGRFIDAEGVRFAAGNFVQFARHVTHMEPYLPVLLVPAILAAAVGLAWGLGAMLLQWKKQTLRRIARVAAVPAGLCMAFALVGPRIRTGNIKGVMDPSFGMIYTQGDLYANCRDERSGPLLHLWAAWRHAGRDAEPTLASDELPVEWRPIVSMEDYARGVDTAKFRRRNVLLILVESLRTDQLQVCGGPRVVMPAVEALAREARVFPNHYTQASHSNYADICPLSSHYPLRSPWADVYAKSPAWPRMPVYDLLKHLGYRTAVISSQNENWGGMANYLQTPGLDHFFHSETYEGQTYLPRGDTSFHRFVQGQKLSGKIDDRFTVSEAIRWIDTQPSQPFFIYMNLQNSHVPYEIPDDFPRRFSPRKLPFIIRFGSFPREHRQTVMNIYADSLAYIDSQLARLFEHLKSRGLLDETIVIVSGDTGQAFYEHGFAGHANMLFNEVMRVPLIVRAPGAVPGVDRRPAQHIDVPPSILHLLGLPPHPAFQGANLFEEPPPKDRSIYLLVQAPLARQYAIVRSGYKLVYDAHRNRRFLFDLKRDPGENNDVAASHPDLARRLAVRLDTWRKLQIEYHRDLGRHRRFYPPILSD